MLLINDLSRAGAETQLVELACALDPKVYDLRIVILKSRNEFAEVLARRGIPVTALGRCGWWDVRTFWRLYWSLRELQPQILHSYLFFANFWGTLLGRAARVPKIILSQRCSYETQLTALWRRLARLSHRLADHVIVNSRAARDEEIAAGYPPERITYVPNGIRVSVNPQGDRDHLGLPQGPLVLSVGQLAEVKGHRDLVEAWPSVRSRHADAHLVFLGDGPLRERLAMQAERLGVASSVHLPGFRASVAACLAASDLLALASLSEGMPNAVLEAMAVGRAVVATRVGGVPDVVVDGETGLLVPPGDPAALARAIADLLSDASRRAAMGAAARRRVEALFSVEAVRVATEAVYGEIAP